MMDSILQAATERSAKEQAEGKQQAAPGSDNSLDEELQGYIQNSANDIVLIGCGGAGNHTISRIKEVGACGARTIAVNTDAQDLLNAKADKKILIGRELTRGLGAGSNPDVGEAACVESIREVREQVNGADLVFVTCGMGGGTGTGSAPIVAKVAKDLGILTIAVITVPFSMEGNRRMENAMSGLSKLKQTVDAVIIILNDKLLELAGELPMNVAFKVSDELLANSLVGFVELLTKAGLVNLDFADMKTVMRDSGLSMISIGEADSTNRAVEAARKAIVNPLLDVDIKDAKGALINIVGGEDMSLDEVNSVVNTVSGKLDEEARVIWGAQIDESLNKSVRVMLVVTGIADERFESIDFAEAESSTQDFVEVESMMDESEPAPEPASYMQDADEDLDAEEELVTTEEVEAESTPKEEEEELKTEEEVEIILH